MYYHIPECQRRFRISMTLAVALMCSAILSVAGCLFGTDLNFWLRYFLWVLSMVMVILSVFATAVAHDAHSTLSILEKRNLSQRAERRLPNL